MKYLHLQTTKNAVQYQKIPSNSAVTKHCLKNPYT